MSQISELYNAIKSYTENHYNFLVGRNFILFENTPAILITKPASQFAYALSINNNKKFNKLFVYINLVKLTKSISSNQLDYEKVIALGQPISIDDMDTCVTKLFVELSIILNNF